MSLAAGSRLGPYEITAPIGAGGMGEVYKARDTRLDRSVAIKVLPPEFSADLDPSTSSGSARAQSRADRRARFEREAKTIAGLNHPHICTLYDVGWARSPQAAGGEPILYLVMEHLTGETLAAHLEKGPLPLEQALDIAAAIADALAAAHRQGVIHRDLKPGNVMLTRTGAKLLDFGLAKLTGHGEQPAAASLASMPTETRPLTSEGAIVGTLQYMAPEQVEGKPADARTDLWALGAILYEMLTGKRAFEGASAASLIGNIMNSQPPALATLQPLTPPGIDRFVRRCLAKDPDDRWQNAADVSDELRWMRETIGVGAQTGVQARHRRGLRTGLTVAGALALLATSVLATWVAARATTGSRPDSGASASVAAHLTVELPDGLQLVASAPAFSPDGRHLAFSALGRSGIAIYVRHLNGFEVREIPGSAGGVNPFFSPDSQWVGFSTGAFVKKAPVNGGQASTVARAAFWVTAATWTASDRLFISGYQGLWSMAPEPRRDGGQPETAAIAEVRGNVVALPDGRVLCSLPNSRETVVAVYDPARDRTDLLAVAGSPVAYLQTGHLVFRQAGRLMVVPFDLARTELSGRGSPILPAAIADAVAFSGTGLVAFLHYPKGISRTLVRVDRAGVHEPLGQEPAGYRWPRLSPDGRRLAVGIGMPDGSSRIAVLDLQTRSRVVLQEDGGSTEPVWTPDGRRLIYSAVRGSGTDLYWQAADGSGTSERLSSLPGDQWPTAVLPDGRTVAFYSTGGTSGSGLWTVTLDGGHRTTQILPSPARIKGARFSPNGKWLVYSSDESGREEIYVRPFPDLDAKWSISTEGGINPVWAADGREIFYRAGARMMVAEVTSAPAFSARPPRVLFEGPFDLDKHGDIDYDMTPDGRHFVMTLVEPAAQPRLRVLANWMPEEMRR